MNLGIIVQYYSNDHFLWPTMREQCLLATPNVVAVRYDHRFDGAREPMDDLGVPTVTLPWHKGENKRLLLNHSRFAGACALPPSCEYYLFLDADEIPEGRRLRTFKPEHSSNYLACHWYFRDARHRAIQRREHSGLLICRHRLDWKRGAVTNFLERKGMRYMDNHVQDVCRDNPLIHHYSWIGPKQRVLAKARTFTHDHKKDWKKLIEESWDKPFTTDFVHGYQYEEVTPFLSTP